MEKGCLGSATHRGRKSPELGKRHSMHPCHGSDVSGLEGKEKAGIVTRGCPGRKKS